MTFEAKALMTCTVIGGITLMYLLVLGSGVLPVHFGVLILIGALAGFLSALPSRRRQPLPRAFVIAAVAATIAVTVASFFALMKIGHTRALRYGADAAHAIAASHAKNGIWPTTLTATRPPDLRWPYTASCRRPGLCKAAGYFVEYELKDGKPRLTVTRRKNGVEWDWANAGWRQLPPT